MNISYDYIAHIGWRWLAEFAAYYVRQAHELL